jgi:hypothetical protein
VVFSSPVLRVTLYVRPKLYGQAFLNLSSSMPLLSPKSSVTDDSRALPVEADSDEFLPRYSHRLLRAKPCCEREDVAWSEGGGPNT